MPDLLLDLWDMMALAENLLRFIEGETPGAERPDVIANAKTKLDEYKKRYNQHEHR